MAFSGGQITRLGPGAFSRQLTGSFAGKVETEPEPDVAVSPTGGWEARRRREARDAFPTETAQARQARIQRAREEMGVVEVVKALDRRTDPRGERERAIAEGLPEPAMPPDTATERLEAVLEAMEQRALAKRKRAAALLLLAI